MTKDLLQSQKSQQNFSESTEELSGGENAYLKFKGREHTSTFKKNNWQNVFLKFLNLIN